MARTAPHSALCHILLSTESVEWRARMYQQIFANLNTHTSFFVNFENKEGK